VDDAVLTPLYCLSGAIPPASLAQPDCDQKVGHFWRAEVGHFWRALKPEALEPVGSAPNGTSDGSLVKKINCFGRLHGEQSSFTSINESAFKPPNYSESKKLD
jgi:hypothetical protein